MTAKEFAEKYVGRAVKCKSSISTTLNAYGLVCGHSGGYICLDNENGYRINKAVITLLYPAQKAFYYEVSQLDFLTGEEMVDKYKGREVEIMNDDNSVYGKGKIIGYSNSYVNVKGQFPTLCLPLNTKILPLNAITTPTIDVSKYPHKCPKCGKPAYVGFSSIDCSANCK
jgi:hypothetical protein